MVDFHKLTEQEWRQLLSEEEFHVCREKGTEPPFSGVYADCKQAGVYRCRCCQAPLFRSSEKYDSGTGWPSFWAPVTEEALKIERDTSHGMIRDEILCAHCGAHLGHLFPDGPQPTGLRYCINSLSLDLEAE